MIKGLHRIWGLMVKELRLLSRDKLLLVFLLLGPLLELTMMGGLTGGGIKNLPLAVVDLDHSRASRELIAKLGQQDELLIKAYGDDVAQAREWMQRGEISVIVVVPPGYAEALLDPLQSAEVSVSADASNSVVSTVAIATAEKVAAEIIGDITARYAAASEGPVELRFMARFNETLSGRPHALTAMLGLIVYQVTLIIASQSFTRERELGTMEQLRVTPLGYLELMAGKAIPTLLIGVVDCLLMTGVVIVWFEIPMRGSLLLLTLLTVPFILVQIGWGTLISLVSRTQQQAILFVFAMAMLEVALSGFMVPANNLPDVMRVLSYISSVRHYTVILRGIMVRGAGFGPLWLPSMALCGIALVVIALAWMRLRVGLDNL
ncbi:MAG: ABC transporter permease [Chloroflexi bacterium]|nr:ABC transporter permease [Chloroflexota bacterium]